ncbi:hypothetical protein Tco_0586457 [Tanacetum coccineum]
MHNNIMAVGPYIPSTVIIPAEPATDDSPAVLERTVVETLLNMSRENKAHYQSEKEAIHLLLTGIGDEIYLIVDACKTDHDMWIAIIRLQQGESLNIQDVKTNLFWEFGKFTSHDGETMESYYSRFYKMMNEIQNHDLDTISYHKLFDILKLYQKEVNEICVERIAKNENPLALVAAAQQYLDPYYQAPKSHKSYAPPSKQSSSTRSHASTRNKGKEIAKPITPPSESASEEDSDPEQAQRDKDMQKNLALIAKYKNDNQTGQFGNQRTVTVVGARETVEKMLLCKQAEKCVPLQAEQADWLEDTDEEIDKQELEAHYSYMVKIQEVPTTDSGIDTEPLKKTELETYKTLNDRTVDYDKLERKLNETLRLLVQKEIDIKKGPVKEKTKVITDLKLKEEKDLDKLIAMEKQLKFVNEIVYKRNQSIQTIYMLAPKGSTYNGRPTFANPMYLKKAQSEKPCLYEILYDTYDPTNRFVPDREETLTLEQESR